MWWNIKRTNGGFKKFSSEVMPKLWPTQGFQSKTCNSWFGYICKKFYHEASEQGAYVTRNHVSIEIRINVERKSKTKKNYYTLSLPDPMLKPHVTQS
jgi:hypothetical protein